MERYVLAISTLAVVAVLGIGAYVLVGRASGGAATDDDFRRGVVERLEGAGLSFVPGSAAVEHINPGSAIEVARREMNVGNESEPVVTYGRLTDPFSRNGPAAGVVVERPVWVVSYPRDMMEVRGPMHYRGPREVPATADIIIDAKTGEFLRSHRGSLAPIGPTPVATYDCSKLPC
jgi:hypothetical protein